MFHPNIALRTDCGEELIGALLWSDFNWGFTNATGENKESLIAI